MNIRWLIIALASIFAIESLYVVYGDDTEDKGRIDTMLQRVEEWNRQTAINETLNTTERFDCEYDESLCVLGIPDPDFSDITDEDKQSICFDSFELANEFIEQNGVPDYDIKVPCPKYNQTLPEDSSGK